MSIRAKQLSHVYTNDLTKIFELDVLLNRGVGEINWEQERFNRIKANTVNAKEGDVRKIARKIFSEGRTRGKHQYKTMQWDDWWKTRWLTVPGGSIHPRLNKLIDKKKEMRGEEGLNKKTLLSNIKDVDIEDILIMKPRIIAYPSEKYEWGKRRAIYGTDVEGFMLSDFAFPTAEQLLPVYVITGTDASAQHVRKVMEQYCGGMMSFCFDYDDFNSQHSAQSMYEVIMAFIDVYSDRMSYQQLQAALWTAQSINAMEVVENSDIGCPGFEAKQTLLSGWRLTTVMNSVLNRAYLEMSGALEMTTASLHSGDDVFSAVDNLLKTEEFLGRVKAHGIRAQESKSFASSIAEFLRVDHKAGTHGTQYLTRASATLVHSRPESREAMTLPMWLGSIRTRTNEMIDRGANKEFIMNLKITQDKRACIEHDTDYRTVEMIERLHPVEGGIDDGAELKGIRLIEEGETLPPSKLVTGCKYGADDMARVMVGIIGTRDNLYERLKEAILKATNRSIQRVRRKVTVIRYPVTLKDRRRATRYGAFRKETRESVVGIFKGIDLSIAVLVAQGIESNLGVILKSSKDPISDLRLMA